MKWPWSTREDSVIRLLDDLLDESHLTREAIRRQTQRVLKRIDDTNKAAENGQRRPQR
jgi:hypothetical protein